MKYKTKVMMAATFVMGTIAAGCQTTTRLATPVTQPITAESLQAYDWQLVDAKQINGEQITALFFDPAKPLTLRFMNDNGRHYMTFINTCNNMGAGYSVVNGTVAIKNVISTMMACPEPQASFDKAALATVKGDFSLSTNAKNVPILTIKNDDRVAYFKAVAK